MHVMTATCTACYKLRTTTEVVVMVDMKISVFWRVTPCLLVYEYVYVFVPSFYLPKERTHFNPLLYMRHDRTLQNLRSVYVFL